MLNQPRSEENPQPEMVYGLVLSDPDTVCWVETEYGRFPAETAVSCLVEPRPGDTVLVSVDRAGVCFILSILRRDPSLDAETNLRFNGPVRMEVSSGGLAIAAEGEMSLASADRMSWAAPDMNLHADRAEAKVESLSLVGRIIDSQVERIKSVAVHVDQVFHRLMQRLVDSVRYVAEHEEVQTGSTRILVEETITVQAQNSVHQAEEIVKIDGGQIHLG